MTGVPRPPRKPGRRRSGRSAETGQRRSASARAARRSSGSPALPDLRRSGGSPPSATRRARRRRPRRSTESRCPPPRPAPRQCSPVLSASARSAERNRRAGTSAFGGSPEGRRFAPRCAVPQPQRSVDPKLCDLSRDRSPRERNGRAGTSRLGREPWRPLLPASALSRAANAVCVDPSSADLSRSPQFRRERNGAGLFRLRRHGPQLRSIHAYTNTLTGSACCTARIRRSGIAPQIPTSLRGTPWKAAAFGVHAPAGRNDPTAPGAGLC